MDQTAKYADILTEVLHAEAKTFPTIPKLRLVASCDRETGHFLLIMVGWDNRNHWHHSISFHAELRHGQVFINIDMTEGVKPQLLEAGIRPEDFLDDREFDYSAATRTAA